MKKEEKLEDKVKETPMLGICTTCDIVYTDMTYKTPLLKMNGRNISDIEELKGQDASGGICYKHKEYYKSEKEKKDKQMLEDQFYNNHQYILKELHELIHISKVPGEEKIATKETICKEYKLTQDGLARCLQRYALDLGVNQGLPRYNGGK